jgi:hypothetical protein
VQTIHGGPTSHRKSRISPSDLAKVHMVSPWLMFNGPPSRIAEAHHNSHTRPKLERSRTARLPTLERTSALNLCQNYGRFPRAALASPPRSEAEAARSSLANTVTDASRTECDDISTDGHEAYTSRAVRSPVSAVLVQTIFLFGTTVRTLEFCSWNVIAMVERTLRPCAH